MHPMTVFSKEHERMSHNSVSPFSSVPWWTGLGSQPADFEEHFALQLNSSCKENPPIGNQLAASHQADHQREQEGILGKEKSPQFSISPGDWGTPADVQKFQLQNASTRPTSVAEQEKHFELGFRPPMGRIMLPLNSTANEGTIFVNAKQYNGILRRRLCRAKAEQENKALRSRKPFLHLSRHLHAMRRPRGCGGRFLNTKNLNDSKDKSDNRNPAGGQLVWATGSQMSEVLQSDSGNSSSPRESNGSRSNNSCSEVTSIYFREEGDPFLLNHLRPTVPALPNSMNARHNIALHNKWVAAADACCNLEV